MILLASIASVVVLLLAAAVIYGRRRARHKLDLAARIDGLAREEHAKLLHEAGVTTFKHRNGQSTHKLVPYHEAKLLEQIKERLRWEHARGKKS